MEFDLLIRGGQVVDGTGAPAFAGDVGIAGDRIAAVGRLDGAGAGRVIDAAGQVVAPGFIDVHVHSELARLGGEDQLAGIRQGVTTELMAPDGFSWAPMSPGRLQEIREYLQVFYGDVPLPFDWHSVSDFLSLFPGRIPGNLVPQVPHLTIRVEVMGWETRPATADEIAVMRGLVVQWLDAGAAALAVGLEYQPTAFSTTAELVELSKVVAERGGLYVTHQRGYWSRLERGSRETFEIGKRARIPVHISHLGVEAQTEAILAQGLAADVDVSFDMYPYAASNTHLMMVLPDWAQAGGHRTVMARLNDPEQRRRMRDETAARVAERGPIALAGVENGRQLDGRALADIARERGLADVDCLFELLVAHGGRVLTIYHWQPHLDHADILRRTLRHPLYVGGSDGIFNGSKPHPRGFGTFARIAGDHVRAGTLSLEQAVRKLTGYSAERFRINDRGLLKPGLAADVVMFDAATLADRASFSAGRTAPVGVSEVLVNGEPVLAGGQPTGKLPGRIVKSLS